jgi:hypothetical protein
MEAARCETKRHSEDALFEERPRDRMGLYTPGIRFPVNVTADTALRP